MTSWVLVNYLTEKNIETFCVSENEENREKTKRLRFLKTVVSYIPLVLKFLL
jgi:hypothetical protein